VWYQYYATVHATACEVCLRHHGEIYARREEAPPRDTARAAIGLLLDPREHLLVLLPGTAAGRLRPYS